MKIVNKFIFDLPAEKVMADDFREMNPEYKETRPGTAFNTVEFEKLEEIIFEPNKEELN